MSNFIYDSKPAKELRKTKFVQDYIKGVQSLYDATMPTVRKMGRFIDPRNTENNYSNMHKRFAAQGAKQRAKIARGLRKAGSSPDNQRNVP